MNLEYVCNQMIRIIHCSICCIHEDGGVGTCLGDSVAEMNSILTDTKFREQIFRREIKPYPDIFHEHDSIFYAVFSIETGKLVIGPVSIERPGKELTDYMIRTHQISENVGFRLAYCEMKTFGSSILMIHHFLTAETHIAYLVFDGEWFIGAGGVSFFRAMPTYHNPTGWNCRKIVCKRSIHGHYIGKSGRK